LTLRQVCGVETQRPHENVSWAGLFETRVYSPSTIHLLRAEFALIPSRDEPFGLVAVKFGRKGALGIVARVGGLGQMVCILCLSVFLQLLINYSPDGDSQLRQLQLLISSTSSNGRLRMRCHPRGKQEWKCMLGVQSNASRLLNGSQVLKRFRALRSRFTMKEAVLIDDRSRSRTLMRRARSPVSPSINPDRSRSTDTAFRKPRHRRSVSHESPQPQPALPTAPSMHLVCLAEYLSDQMRHLHHFEDLFV
jgi:hypothetical protein